jgi:rubrerythrin
MTQAPMSTVLSDCQYNIIKQLEKELQFLWHVDGYIKDAEKEGNQECAKVFMQIKADEEKHVKMLKGLLQIK